MIPPPEKKWNPQRLAELSAMLGKMTAAERETLLGNLSAREPGLAEELRKGLFPFEDLAVLQDAELQLVLGKLPRPLLALALRGCEPVLFAKLLSVLPARRAAELTEEIEALGKQKLSDVEAARMKICAIARELEDAGEISRAEPSI